MNSVLSKVTLPEGYSFAVRFRAMALTAAAVIVGSAVIRSCDERRNPAR